MPKILNKKMKILQKLKINKINNIKKIKNKQN